MAQALAELATEMLRVYRLKEEGRLADNVYRPAGEYERGWRNRSYTFYTQFCYQDELELKLKGLLDKYGEAFDDIWYYFYPKKKKPDSRPTAVRRPLWQEKEERFGVTAEKSSVQMRKP